MELWQIFFKNVPREERETYEHFFKRMQGLTDEIIRDPTSVELDAFAKRHREGSTAPNRSAMGLVARDNAEMAHLPYEWEESEQARAVKSTQAAGRWGSRGKKRSSLNASRRGVSGQSTAKPPESQSRSPRKRANQS